MADLTNEEKLAEARTALHLLLTGQKEVSLSYRDRTIVYTQASVAQLRGYINELEALIALEAGACVPRRYFNFQM